MASAAAWGSLLAYDDKTWLDWSWVTDHVSDLRHLTAQHLELTALAVAIGLLISIPLAVLSHRRRWLQAPVLGTSGIIFTIPSIALLAILVPYTGFTRTTSEIALVGYTLLILIRNTLAGLDGVPADVREAATAMGFTPMRSLLRIELPVALPAIIAGIRIATVTTIGLVTITALIGQGGYGQLIYDGLIRSFRTPLLVGAVLSVLLALVADIAFVALERLVTPWSRAKRA